MIASGFRCLTGCARYRTSLSLTSRLRPVRRLYSASRRPCESPSCLTRAPYRPDAEREGGIRQAVYLALCAITDIHRSGRFQRMLKGPIPKDRPTPAPSRWECCGPVATQAGTRSPRTFPCEPLRLPVATPGLFRGLPEGVYGRVCFPASDSTPLYHHRRGGGMGGAA